MTQLHLYKARHPDEPIGYEGGFIRSPEVRAATKRQSIGLVLILVGFLMVVTSFVLLIEWLRS